jgi:succinyl-CoA synthetase beta subunit
MNYACSIHMCRSARERNAASTIEQEVSRVNKFRPPLTARELQARLHEAIQAAQLRDADLHEVHINGRVDVLVNGRTVMSWTPLYN